VLILAPIGGEADIGEEGGDEPEAGAAAVDGTHDRLGNQARQGDRPAAAPIEALPGLRDAVELLHVEAGAEGSARSGEHDDPHLVARCRLLEEIVEGRLKLPVPGVGALGPVEPEREHAMLVEAGQHRRRVDTLHRHSSPLLATHEAQMR
jgi:hypothetical protein